MGYNMVLVVGKGEDYSGNFVRNLGEENILGKNYFYFLRGYFDYSFLAWFTNDKLSPFYMLQGRVLYTS